MTALDQYTRLEAVGFWRETPDSDPSEVLVSFGDSTLLLSNFNELPLAHWAMAAISEIHSNDKKTVYSPDAAGFETLEIDDKSMIEAIAQVSIAANAVQHNKRPIIRWFLLILALCIVASITFFGPKILRQQAQEMANEEVAYRMGTSMLDKMGFRICSRTRSNLARDILISKTFPNGSATLVIIESLSDADIYPTVFPGNILILSEASLFAMQTPHQLQATLNNMVSSNDGDRALEYLFNGSTLSDIFAFVSTGTLSDHRLSLAGSEEINRHPRGYVENQPSQASLLLRDQDWVALQNICLN